MPLKVMYIGQAPFGADTLKQLAENGHSIVAFVPNDNKAGRADAVATQAETSGVKFYKIGKWKEDKPRKVDASGRFTEEAGAATKEVMDILAKEGPFDVGVLAFVPFFVPMEVINTPKQGSLIYHPSLLPRHRGASAINWTILSGDKKGGFTVFWGDDGLDTGDICLQQEFPVDENATLSDFNRDVLFPNGAKGIVEAVNMVAKGTAPRIKQPKEGETYAELWQKPAQVDWSKSSGEVHNYVRGSDRAPGAFTTVGGDRLMLYGSRLVKDAAAYPDSAIKARVTVEDPTYAAKEACIVDGGLLFKCGDGGQVLITEVNFKGTAMKEGGIADLRSKL